MPFHEHLDDRLSFWLLKHLDTKTMTVNTRNGEALPIKDVDVHIVLGIPFIGARVHHDNQCDKDVVKLVTSALSFRRPGVRLTLEYLEGILTENYGGRMDEEERVAFKIAVVLYSMSYFLAVYQPVYRFPFWLLRNFSDITKICDLNWSGYILSIIAHAAERVQKTDLSEKITPLYGCTFFLQVFYLDNLNFGASSPLHMDMPRACIFNPDYLQRLADLDSNQEFVGGEYFGKSKIRDEKEICYSRAWGGHTMEEWMRREKCFEETTVLLHEAMSSTKDSLKQLRAAVVRLGIDIATAMKLNFDVLHHGYNPVAEPCLATSRRNDGTFLINKAVEWQIMVRGYRLHFHTSTIGCEFLNKVRKEATPLAKELGFKRKLVTSHSNFDESPFAIEYYHPGIPRKRRMVMYSWFKEGRVTHNDLIMTWFCHNVPTKLELTGHEIKFSLMINGKFSTAVCNAIMRLYNQLEDSMYDNYNFVMKKRHIRWRHFMCPSFAETVLNREDYINSYEVRTQFIGPHFEYNLEDCAMIILPVLYAGKWSCYFWDFSSRTITVLDPMMMHMLPLRVEFTHDEVLEELHDALFACIECFFDGWHVEKEGWNRNFPTHISPRSRTQNSGLYTVHYARAFDGDSLGWKLNTTEESNLGDARSDLLYMLLTMDGNEGYMPPDLKQALEKACKRRRMG